jgi:hypothetical protein
VLLAWREAIYDGKWLQPNLPRGLARAAKAARRVRVRRALQHEGSRDVLAVLKCRERQGFLTNALRRLIARHCPAWLECSLELKPRDQGDQGYLYTFIVTLVGKLAGCFTISRDWFQDVYEQGLAVYKGNPVVWVSRQPSGPCDDQHGIEFVQPAWDWAGHPWLQHLTAVQGKRPGRGPGRSGGTGQRFRPPR